MKVPAEMMMNGDVAYIAGNGKHSRESYSTAVTILGVRDHAPGLVEVRYVDINDKQDSAIIPAGQEMDIF
jgi:hypothetical protein